MFIEIFVYLDICYNKNYISNLIIRMIFDYQIQDSETCYCTIKTDHIVPTKKRTVSFTNRTVCTVQKACNDN